MFFFLLLSSVIIVCKVWCGSISGLEVFGSKSFVVPNGSHRPETLVLEGVVLFQNVKFQTSSTTLLEYRVPDERRNWCLVLIYIFLLFIFFSILPEILLYLYHFSFVTTFTVHTFRFRRPDDPWS